MTFFTPGTGCLVKSDPSTGRTLKVIFTSTAVTPGSFATASPAWLASRSLAGERPAVAVSIVNVTRPPSIGEILDELERDDVALERGIAHAAEGVDDGSFGNQLRSCPRPSGRPVAA